MPASPRYWICVVGSIGIGSLIVGICFRKRLQNCITKCRNWSVRGRDKEVSVSFRPRQGCITIDESRLRDMYTGQDGREEPTLVFQEPEVRYGPDRKLTTNYMREKYGLSPMNKRTLCRSQNE